MKRMGRGGKSCGIIEGECRGSRKGMVTKDMCRPMLLCILTYAYVFDFGRTCISTSYMRHLICPLPAEFNPRVDIWTDCE